VDWVLIASSRVTRLDAAANHLCVLRCQWWPFPPSWPVLRAVWEVSTCSARSAARTNDVDTDERRETIIGGGKGLSVVEDGQRPAPAGQLAGDGGVGDHGSLAAQVEIVARHAHGTAVSRFLPRSWDHRNCQSWDHHRRACRGRGRLSAITSGRSIWRARVAFREVRVHEVREVLRHWVGTELGQRPIAERAGVDRKTVRRYLDAAVELGVCETAGSSS
jgi:hypothetical protein